MAIDFDQLGNLVVVYGLKVIGGIAIALAGWWLAGFAERVARNALLKPAHLDETVATFLASLAYYAVLAVAFVLILQTVGIQATSLVAVLGAASLAIGLALQGTLSNMAAGVMLLIFRPLRIGDSIEVAGKSGTVRNLNLFMTELASGDNVQVLIPNGQVWGAALTNYSAYPTRRVSSTFLMPIDGKSQPIVEHLQGELERDERVLKTPPPKVVPTKITDKTVEITMEAWSKAADAGALQTDLARRTIQSLQLAPR